MSQSQVRGKRHKVNKGEQFLTKIDGEVKIVTVTEGYAIIVRKVEGFRVVGGSNDLVMDPCPCHRLNSGNGFEQGWRSGRSNGPKCLDCGRTVNVRAFCSTTEWSGK